MVEATAGSSSASEIHASASRSVIRSGDGGIAGFLAGGLLPGLLLAALGWFALGPFAQRDIEGHVREGVRAALDAEPMSWPTATVSGQQVVLSGTPPDALAADKALRIAREATCATWLGPRICAVQVVGAFAPVPAVPAPAVPAPAESVAAAAAQACDRALAQQLEGARIEFASGSAVILPASNALLDRLAAAAQQCPGRLLIEGHTDNVGAAADNQALSLARANAVSRALAERGLQADRLQASGLGAEKPLAPNDTAAGRARNRRIEVRTLRGT